VLQFLFFFFLNLPWLPGDAFGIPAEGLVCYGARGDAARGGPGEGGGRGLRDLLAQVADPLLLLVLGQGEQKHFARRRHVVVHWTEGGKVNTIQA